MVAITRSRYSKGLETINRLLADLSLFTFHISLPVPRNLHQSLHRLSPALLAFPANMPTNIVLHLFKEMKRVGAGEQDLRNFVTDVRPKMRCDQIKENAFPNRQWVFVLADVTGQLPPENDTEFF
jgi:hypothetical protein